MKTVVVIGAGPAGLTTAYQLLKSNEKFQIIIIEKCNQAGGISKTVKHRENRIDLGGHRFFSKEEEINKIWLELLPLQGTPIDEKFEVLQKDSYLGVVDPNIEDQVMLQRRRVSRIYYDNKFFDYPINIDLDTLKKLGLFKSIKCAGGYLWSSLFKCKGNSLEAFYINRFGKPLYELFFKEYTTKLWGVSPKELDSSWGEQRVKKLSLSKVIFDFIGRTFCKHYKTKDTSLIEEFYYPKYGPGQLWETMAKVIEDEGGKFIYNATCREINFEDTQIKSIKIQFANGGNDTIDCDYLISSMPIKELIASMAIDVPKDVRYIADNLPYRDFITVGVLVKRVLLHNNSNIKTLNDIPPDCWIYVQDRKVKMGRIQIFNNWSPFLVNKPKDTVWLGLEYFCSETEQFWNMSEKEIEDMAIKELQQMNIIDKEDVLDCTVLKQQKAYPAYFGTYSQFDKVRLYLQQFTNLICVGRNGQHRYNNMDHSMLTGIQAANYIMGKNDIYSVWNVNTEKKYHEEGKYDDNNAEA